MGNFQFCWIFFWKIKTKCFISGLFNSTLLPPRVPWWFMGVTFLVLRAPVLSYDLDPYPDLIPMMHCGPSPDRAIWRLREMYSWQGTCPIGKNESMRYPKLPVPWGNKQMQFNVKLTWNKMFQHLLNKFFCENFWYFSSLGHKQMSNYYNSLWAKFLFCLSCIYAVYAHLL